MFVKQFSHIVNQGIQFLQSQQQDDGSFLSLSSSNPKTFTPALNFHSTFSTALILQCLNILSETPLLKDIKAKSAHFLLLQKSDDWSWNYWARNSEEAKKMAYPDDLDDTFCAASALLQYERKIITPAALAKFVTMLTLLEQQEGGPYKTWLVDESAEPIWQDVDIVVNSNIAYFLFLQGITLPNLKNFFTSTIENKQLTSPYYPTPYPLIYFLSRFYKSRGKRVLQEILWSKQKSEYWENPLNTSLAVLALLNFGVSSKKLQQSIEYLVKANNNMYKPFVFYTGVNPQRTIPYYAGSGSLTTAYCLAALHVYHRNELQAHKEPFRSGLQNRSGTGVYKLIYQKATERFDTLPKELREHALQLLKKMQKKDRKSEISLLSYYFYESLKKKKSISQETIIKLGLANVFGWLAYTIFDDIVDEKKNEEYIFIATVALREVIHIYENLLPDNLEFTLFFQTTMDILDSANFWELTKCRVPVSNGKLIFNDFSLSEYANYNQLNQKSFGHALGPITIFFILGFKEDSAEIQQLIMFFRHFLIAKQLHDDAHDFQKDIQTGNISPVCSLLLKKFFEKNQMQDTIAIKKITPSLQELFWQEIIEDVCDVIQTHILKAREYGNALSSLVTSSFFEELLLPIEKGTQQALEEKEKTLKFLKMYNSDHI